MLTHATGVLAWSESHLSQEICRTYSEYKLTGAERESERVRERERERERNGESEREMEGDRDIRDIHRERETD